jgi:glycosyltransferase involved in cell wall biosynthesis
MDSRFPKISVMIPTYNRAHFLVEAVESVLSQDYPNVEVIVSDNASTDGTREVARKYQADYRFRYYRNEKNMGSGTNYEILLYKYAQGEYGKYLTDDDYLIDREHLSKAMRIIQKYNVKMVFSASVNKFEDENEYINMSLNLNEAVDSKWWIDHLCRTANGVTIFPSCMSGNVFEIERAKNLSAFRSGQYYHDYEFAIKCILMDKVTGYIREPSYVERRHSGQDGRTSFRNARMGARIFDNIYDFGMEVGVDKRVLDRLRLRGFRFFARGFLVQNWINENGNSIGSLCNFLKELRKVHRYLPFIAVADVHTMVKFLSRGTPLYYLLRNMYLRAHRRK